MSFRALLAKAALGLCIACGLWSTASAQAAAAPQPEAHAAPGPTARSPEDNYILGPDDVIEVSVLGRTDFTTRGRIAADGTIQLPYLGAVPAAKRTARQFGDELAHALEVGGYFAHPIMKVDVVSYASRYVIVLGSVATPGLVPIDRAYRLSEILARAGGVREGGADYVVLRPENGPERHLSVNSLATGDSAADPYVQPGDKIYVPQAELFYISGEVKAPGAYPMVTDMTIRMAIGRGGGLTDSGSERRIQITRHGAKLAHTDLDTKVEPGDVIVAGESIF